MPTKSTTFTGTYRVANPRGIEKGVRILCTDDREWYEGDAIDPADLGDAFAHYLDRGFVEETE